MTIIRHPNASKFPNREFEKICFLNVKTIIVTTTFGKIEKIDFFEIFFLDLRPNIDFPAEFRPEIGRKPFHTIIPPSKKMEQDGSMDFGFSRKNVFGLHFGQNKVYYLRSLKSLN